MAEKYLRIYDHQDMESARIYFFRACKCMSRFISTSYPCWDASLFFLFFFFLSSWSYVHEHFFLNLNLFVRCNFGVVATNLLRPSSSSSPLAKDDVKLSLYCNLIHLQAFLLNDVSCNWNFSHLCFIKITRRWNFP